MGRCAENPVNQAPLQNDSETVDALSFNPLTFPFPEGVGCTAWVQPRHTFTTRLVYTVVPSECYAPGGATVDGLLEVLVSDLMQLQTEGLEVGLTKHGYFHHIFYGMALGFSMVYHIP